MGSALEELDKCSPQGSVLEKLDKCVHGQLEKVDKMAPHPLVEHVFELIQWYCDHVTQVTPLGGEAVLRVVS